MDTILRNVGCEFVLQSSVPGIAATPVERYPHQQREQPESQQNDERREVRPELPVPVDRRQDDQHQDARPYQYFAYQDDGANESAWALGPVQLLRVDEVL